MKILFVVSSNSAGLVRYTQCLQDKLKQNVSSSKIFLYTKNISSFFRIATISPGFDLIHYQGSNFIMLIYIYILSLCQGFKFVLTPHHLRPHNSRSHAYMILYKYLFLLPHLLIFHKHKEKTAYQKWVNTLKKNCYIFRFSNPYSTVIPHGVYTSNSDNPIEDVIIYQHIMSLAKNKIICIIPGYVRKSKNIHYLLSYLIKNISQALAKQILIISIGKWEVDLQEEYNLIQNDLSVSPYSSSFIIQNQFLPASDFDEIFRISDIVLLPYSISSASGILSQAIAESKICITSPIEAFKEHACKTNSILLSVIELFTYQIETVISDYSAYKYDAECYSQTYRAEHSWEKIARMHSFHYRSLF